MKLSQLVEGYSGPDVDVTGLTADSRAVEAGFLFAGLPGVAVDGALFIEQALSNGASAVLTHEKFDGSVPETVPLLKRQDPRLLLAQMASRFYAPQPETVIGVTGTNGKTSVASFVRQIWEQLGIAGASLGTIGVVSKGKEIKLNHTTPDPVTLHHLMQELALEGVDHLALEASSHGLAQRRLDGISFKAAAFTNITRDHLDYHETFEAYFNEKKRLFSELLHEDGVAVIDADAAGAEDIIQICKNRSIRVSTIGHKGEFIRVDQVSRHEFSQRLNLSYLDEAGNMQQAEILLPLVGEFQTSNVLVAAALVAAGGVRMAEILPILADIKGAKGRLELAGSKKLTGTEVGAPVFIDYAHTPDALENAIKALLPYKQGKLVVVFGCGGDRDRGKRAIMGEIAARLADRVIVTDDNPRNEDAASIRAEIMAAAVAASETEVNAGSKVEVIEIGERSEAVRYAIAGLGVGDVLLLAGKGHETGQIVKGETLPFSDHEAVAAGLFFDGPSVAH